MIVDAHMHFEPKLMDTASLLKKMDSVNLSSAVLVSALTDPPEGPKPAWLMKIQRWMFYHKMSRPLAIKITKSMYAEKDTWRLGMFGKKDQAPEGFKILQRPDNITLSQLARDYPERFYFWLFINPTLPDWKEEFSRFKNTPGLVGIKLHPFWHHYDVKASKPVLELAIKQDLPVNIHLGFDGAGDFQWLADNFPRAKIIFGHLGVPFYKDTWRVIKNNPNYFTDIASLYHVDKKLVMKAIQYLGPYKLLFASDLPYSPHDTINIIRNWIENSNLTAKEKQAVFYSNFQSILKKSKA